MNFFATILFFILAISARASGNACTKANQKTDCEQVDSTKPICDDTVSPSVCVGCPDLFPIFFSDDDLCCYEGAVNDNGQCREFCGPNKDLNNGVCECQRNLIFIKLTGECCREGQVNLNGQCADECAENYIQMEDGTCDCDKSLNVNKLMNLGSTTDFRCCGEGMVNQAGQCVEECDGDTYVRNAEGICDCREANAQKMNGVCCPEGFVREDEMCGPDEDVCPNVCQESCLPNREPNANTGICAPASRPFFFYAIPQNPLMRRSIWNPNPWNLGLWNPWNLRTRSHIPYLMYT